MTDARHDPIDTLRHIETPEGVELVLRAAGPIARGGAFMLDLGIRFLAYTVAAVALGLLGETGNGMYLIFMFCVEWFYPVVFEVLRAGATPGKKVFGIATVRDDGRPLDWTTSIIRNFMRIADFLPFFYFFGVLSMLLDKDFKRLGDHAASTMVVYVDEITLDSYQQAVNFVPVQPPIPLSLVEERAIVAFAERMVVLSHERQEELASMLSVLVGDQDRPRRLVSLARWILGHRPNDVTGGPR